MTPDQEALLRRAYESLQGARLLANAELYNIAISRAYYVMFYIAEALLVGEGFTFSKHSAVVAAFGQQFVRTGRIPVEFQRYLIDAQADRHIGDYDYHQNVSASRAALQISFAEQFIQLAERLLGPLPPSDSTRL